MRRDVRSRLYSLAGLCLVAVYLLSVARQSAPSSSKAARASSDDLDGECSAAYEACGAVPAPVGFSRCCDEEFFCFTVPPYFSQCRPRCSALGERCDGGHRPCCAGARCGDGGVCVARASAWYAHLTWRGHWNHWRRRVAGGYGDGGLPGLARRDGGTARDSVARFSGLLNGFHGPPPKIVVGSIPNTLTMIERLRLRRRVVRALRDPGLSVNAKLDKVIVEKDRWTMAEVYEVALVLVAFPQIKDVLPR